MKPRRNEPDWCTTWLGRLQQDGDGRFRFIQRSFRLILWHHWGWKWISGLFVQHKSSTFQKWPIPILTREINDVCLHWPRSFIPFTILLSHLPCPNTEGAAVAASLHQPSTPPCGIYTINTCPTPPPVSIHLSVYITLFQPLHPSQPEWDNRNWRWRGIWNEASLLYALEPCYFSIPAIKFGKIQGMTEEWRLGEKVNWKSLLVLTDRRTLITQWGHVRSHSSLTQSVALITKIQLSDRSLWRRWQLTQSESFWELWLCYLIGLCWWTQYCYRTVAHVLPTYRVIICYHGDANINFCSIIRYLCRAIQESDWHHWEQDQTCK